MDSIISFAQNNTIIAIVLALGLLYFLYRKPKLFFVLLFLGLFLYGLYYMITSMGGSGAAQKKKMIQQEEKQAD
jgi:multisubunit Na+/H+ antiporter MnhC subunit